LRPAALALITTPPQVEQQQSGGGRAHGCCAPNAAAESKSSARPRLDARLRILTGTRVTTRIERSITDEGAMPQISIHNPDALGKPLGQYSQITRVKASELLFIAGQVATDKSGKTIGAGDFDAQCGQVFANIAAALKSQDADFANVVEFTTYLVHSQDIAKFMSFRLREFPRLFPGGLYPPNTLLIVDRLVQEQFLIEVHTVAAL
jgi:enamine deaminase RidA (YjgF/YER057c/UK114 family)